MKVTTEKIENRQAHMIIEMEPADLEEGLTKAYHRLVKKYAIPGFRKGKTPRPILEQYLGKEAFLEDAVENMAPEAYEKAVKEQDLKPIAQPEVHLDKQEPVTYKMIVPLEPVIKLGDYRSIRIAREPVQVKDEEVDAAIERLRRQHSVWEPVDRQVNSSDMVILDINSNIGDQPYINQENAEFEVVKDSEYPMKGFAEQLIGMKQGETKEFKLSFPEDYARNELAGKEAAFKISVKEIKQEKLPELNDELVKQINPDYKSVDELKTKVRESLQKASEENAKKDFEQKIVDAVVGMSEVEYPPIMEEGEIDSLIQQQMRRWQMDQKGMEQYLESIKKTGEQLREDLRPLAIRSIKQSLVMTQVAMDEKIQVEKEDLHNEMQDMTKGIAEDKKDKMLEILNNPQIQVNIASGIATRRTLDRLVEIATSPAPAVQESTDKETENEKVSETETTQKEVKE